MATTNGSLFMYAREVASHCTDWAKRTQLRSRTNEAQAAFNIFRDTASRDAMEILVARWTRMLIAIDTVGPMPDGDPTSAGRLKVPLTLPSTGPFDHDPDIHEVLTKAA